MSSPIISPKHPAIRDFYAQREQLTTQNAKHELAVREPFKALLNAVASTRDWTLVVEQKVEGLKKTIRPDGTLRDANTLPRGYWEAKDTRDDLEAEIGKKFALGYPKTNIIFEDTRKGVLFQAGERVGEYDLTQPEQVVTLINRFLSYTEPNIAGFEQAVNRFKQDTPELAKGLLKLIADAHKSNKRFQSVFGEFFTLCQNAINLNISKDAVNEMLIQHLLTERLMRTVFDNPDFARRNVIATEIEKVIDALTSTSFSRSNFLGQLDYFYEAIEAAAKDLRGFTERQTFINAVYERFFQGYAIKVADTHGIVYTPQPIVEFMCAAVEETLHTEFGLKLYDEQVCIIDPCTGTGNFIINLLHRIHKQDPSKLEDVYSKRLFANEVMLLPYYVASLNIEHAYFDLAKTYAPFEGLCFVDTLDLAEGAQQKLAFMTEKNSERVERQKQAPITVIIGNPPYNVGQLNENDNNKNRAYQVIDSQIRHTYSSASTATNKNALFDAYVKFFRWASDRLAGKDGIVCYVSNNSFVDQLAFDGMRKHLLQDFTTIYHLDLHGNVRQNPKLSGTTHNVFGIQVGVGITVAVRSNKHIERRLLYHRVPEMWRKEDKLGYLERMVAEQGRHNSLNTVEWRTLTPDNRHTWLVPQNADEFASFIPMGSKATKAAKSREVETIFKTYGRGVATSRDDVAYNYHKETLIERVQAMIEAYNSEVDRYKRAGKPKDIDNFVRYVDVNWSRDLKLDLVRGHYAEFADIKVRTSLYRPFAKQYLFFDRILNEEVYVFPSIFPTAATEQENRVISVGGYGRKEFAVFMTQHISDLNFYADPAQCFPFYTYDADGTNRRENITDWALAQFRAAYPHPLTPSPNDREGRQMQSDSDSSPLSDFRRGDLGVRTITKWDIFYYVYAVLHQPEYRTKYAANLKRDLPRLPFVDFWQYADAGRQLAELHLHYETVEPYPLEYKWTAGQPVSYRVEKMKLNKDKTALIVNPSLTLAGIPSQTFDYRLGNRSALDWVIDQYQVKTDKRSGMTSDPNQYSEDEQYIVKLVGRVIAVSLKTVELVKRLR